MEFKVFSNGKTKVIRLIGTLNLNTFEDIENDLMKLIVPKSNIVFNLDKCSYISNSGFRILSIIKNRLVSLECKVVFSGVTEEAKDMMEVTGFNNIVELINNN